MKKRTLVLEIKAYHFIYKKQTSNFPLRKHWFPFSLFSYEDAPKFVCLFFMRLFLPEFLFLPYSGGKISFDKT